MKLSKQLINTCDLCGKFRGVGGHPACSKKKQLLAKNNPSKTSKRKTVIADIRESRFKYFSLLNQ